MSDLSGDDFDKLLDDFIASQLQDTEDQLQELEESRAPAAAEPADAQPEEINSEIAAQIVAEQQSNEKFNRLAEEERMLFNAYKGFVRAVKSCCQDAAVAEPVFSFSEDDILPRFRPSRSANLSNDIVAGWEALIACQPVRLSSLPVNAADEQILSFAEKTTDRNLQMALISYVETLIETESCEIAYNLRKIRYERRQIEKKIYEEQQQRREKIRKYIDAVRAGRFPVDAEMLVNNFFKTARKDAEGAKKMLENNPATFAPIQVDKIPTRFFGMIKPKPEDGIKVNKKLGKFLKNLKA